MVTFVGDSRLQQPADEYRMLPDNIRFRQVLADLLRIARVAMPPHLQAQDIRLVAAEQLIAALEAGPDADIVEGLDLFLREDFAPATRDEAVSVILRDWLVGHGYLPPSGRDG